MMTLDRTRPGVAAMAVWDCPRGVRVRRRVLQGARAVRRADRMHQAIQFLIADMATKVHVARLATWASAVLVDQGRRNTLESSHAKRFAADSAMEVTTDAVQVYGGYGFIKVPALLECVEAALRELNNGAARAEQRRAPHGERPSSAGSRLTSARRRPPGLPADRSRVELIARRRWPPTKLASMTAGPRSATPL
jgi:alkylation response protein AidB-like acyl-CoA dehydrogenase